MPAHYTDFVVPDSTALRRQYWTSRDVISWVSGTPGRIGQNPGCIPTSATLLLSFQRDGCHISGVALFGAPAHFPLLLAFLIRVWTIRFRLLPRDNRPRFLRSTIPAMASY